MKKYKFFLLKENDIVDRQKNVNYKRFTRFSICAIITTIFVLYSFRNLFDSNQVVSAYKSIRTIKYYVKTQHCKIPRLNPFSKSAAKIFKPQKYPCSQHKPYVSAIYNPQLQHYILQMKSNDGLKISCCSRKVVQKGLGTYYADEQYSLLPCVNFTRYMHVPNDTDGMIIECISNRTTKIVQRDAFSFIQPRNSDKIPMNATTSQKKISVFLIGIDSLSRFNFRRNMPKTTKYLEQNQWFELEGYNKVGENTFPNLMPILTGYNKSQAFSQCKPDFFGGLDSCDFIWKHFKQHGYRTAYGEDHTEIGTFNYEKRGFSKPPTDHYLRPLLLAIEKHFKIVKWNRPYCCGRRQCGEYVYDFGLEFFKRYRNQPAFGLFWTNTFSHEKFNTASGMDTKMREYFEKLERNGILADAIVVFLSDHGARWGPLVRLPEGFLEERLPMFFISLPTWFQIMYPDFVRALQINRNRLTTPYDIHQTLKHILDLSGDTTSHEEAIVAPSCPGAQSIFREITEQRTCKDACIPEHWCACSPYEVLPINRAVRTNAKFIVNEINNYLKVNNFSSRCKALKLKTIEKAELKIEEEASKELNKETLRIEFITSPENVTFQATVEYNLKTHNTSVGIENINRLNSDANHSNCVENKLAKTFCICVR